MGDYRIVKCPAFVSGIVHNSVSPEGMNSSGFKGLEGAIFREQSPRMMKRQRLQRELSMNNESALTLSLHERLRRRMPNVRVTQALIVLNVLVFLASVLSGAGLGMTPSEVPLAWGANFGPATQDGEWWRLGSAMFLHFGVVHLAMNMWALWDGGQLVERMFGRGRFLLVYLLAGVSGNLLSLVAHRGASVSGGASGAIFGLYGALLIYLWQERRHLHPREFRWLFWGAVVFSVAIIVIGVAFPMVDNAAHIGGFVCGLLAGMVLSPNKRSASLRRIAAGAALVLVASCGLLVSQIPPPAYRWSDEAAARREISEFLRNEASVARAWQEIVDESRRGDASFGELAGRIDSDITGSYERSFEHLSQVPVSPGLPSGPRIGMLRDYAAQRRDASRLLAEGLRDGDAAKVKAALALEGRVRSGTQAPASR